MELNFTDYVSAIAVLVAALSALYARWAVKETKNATREAKRANEISLLSRRQEIYDAFVHLKEHMSQQRRSAQKSEVSKFHYSSLSAKAFLKAELAEDINNYYDACFSVAEIYRANDGRLDAGNRELQEPHLTKEKSLSESLEKQFSNIFKEIHN